MDESWCFRPIGTLHSPHKEAEKTPIQPRYAEGAEGAAEIFEPYAQGLRDLEGFSHLYLIYSFHRAGTARLVVTPFLDDTPRGVFATRAPCRPNPIGLSVVRLLGIEGNRLALADLDMLDGTPLLDIKPYVPGFEPRGEVRCGWVEAVDPGEAEIRGRRGRPE